MGNYNRLVLPCGQRLAAVPSITLSRLAAADLAAGFPQDAFVVDGFENAPAAYSGTAYWTSSEYRYAPAVSDPFPGRPTAAQASAFASASYSGTEFARTGLWRSVAALDPGSDASEALGTSLVSGFSEAAEGPAYAGTSCDALPRWANARFAPGSPTAQRQPWQNGNPLAPCHYECLADWKGEGCADRDAAC